MSPLRDTKGADSGLRTYLAMTLVTIFVGMTGCFAEHTNARVETLENENNDRKVHEAIIEKDVKDFRVSFEEFKRDVKDDIQRHK